MKRRTFLALAVVLALAAPAWAAFPSVGARGASNETSATTSHDVSLPSGLTANQQVWAFVVFPTGSDPTVSWPSGWTSQASSACGGGSPTCWFAAARRYTDGTESATVVATTTSSVTSSHISLRIIGAFGFQSVIAGTSNSTANPNPINVALSTNGAQDALFIQVLASAAVSGLAVPASYSNLHTQQDTGRNLASAERQLNAASEDAGAWTNGATPWFAVSIAVYPSNSAPHTRCTGAATTSPSGTSHTVNLPPSPGHIAGDLFIAFMASSDTTTTFPGGWTQGRVLNNGSSIEGTVYYRQTDGTEGSTMTVTTSTSVEAAFSVACYGGHENPSINPPTFSTGATGASGSADPDAVTPSGGAKNYLFIAFAAINNASTQTAPSGYFLVANGSSGLFTRSFAYKPMNAASEDPGAFTGPPGNPNWVAFTIAVPPDEVDPVGARRRIILSKPRIPFLDWFLVREAHAADAWIGVR